MQAQVASGLLSPAALASNPRVIVFIAREGKEIGEFPRSQLEELARAGRLRPSDYYWYEGMETWLLLVDFLGEDAWALREKSAPSPAVEALPIFNFKDIPARVRAQLLCVRERLPAMRAQLIWLGGLALGVFLLALLVIYRINSSHSAPSRVSAALDSTQPKREAVDPDEVRDRAAADLQQRIDRLPSQPAPPLHSFYYGIAANMESSFSKDIPWSATIRGGENTVDPETQATVMHTDFVLTAEYRKGEWFFKSYRASVSDMLKSSTTEVLDDESTPILPSIVSILGLKTRSP